MSVRGAGRRARRPHPGLGRDGQRQPDAVSGRRRSLHDGRATAYRPAGPGAVCLPGERHRQCTHSTQRDTRGTRDMMSNSMTEVAPVAAPAAAATASPPGGAVHPLSFAQQRLWFIDRIDGASTQYNLPLAIRLCGTLDRPSLQAAFDRLMARHSVLRTSFHVIDGVVRQHVGAPAPFVLEERDVSGAPAQQDVIDAAVCEEIERTFDLARDPMMRATLLRLTGPGQPAEHILLITLHHIAADGWSLRLLVQEFVRMYLASLQGLDDPLAPLTMDYAQYAAWQRQRLSPTYLADQLAYWRRQLEGIALVHALPLDRPRPPQPLSDAGRYLQPIGSSLHQQLQALAKRHRASLFMVLQSMFAVVLGRRS